VADQPGHPDPALTLRVYAHAMREEETDLWFAEFAGSERLYPAPEVSRRLIREGPVRGADKARGLTIRLFRGVILSPKLGVARSNRARSLEAVSG
jgi:hypothetical protein